MDWAKTNCKPRWEALKLWDSVQLILEIWWQCVFFYQYSKACYKFGMIWNWFVRRHCWVTGRATWIRNIYMITESQLYLIHKTVWWLWNFCHVKFTQQCQCWVHSLGGEWIFTEIYCSWWCHQMETFSLLLALCVGNSPVTGEFPSQRPVTRSFDILFDLHLE